MTNSQFEVLRAKTVTLRPDVDERLTKDDRWLRTLGGVIA